MLTGILEHILHFFPDRAEEGEEGEEGEEEEEEEGEGEAEIGEGREGGEEGAGGGEAMAIVLDNSVSESEENTPCVAPLLLDTRRHPDQPRPLKETADDNDDDDDDDVVMRSGDPLIGGQVTDQPETQPDDNWWDDANEAKTESWYNSIEDQIFLQEMERYLSFFLDSSF